MDLITSYQEFADKVDQCEDEELLKQYQNQSTFTNMQKEFWKQRQNVFNAQDPLKKRKANVKLQWLQELFNCSIPTKKSIKKFTAPNGLFGIVISPEAVVGNNCVIFQQVYIGANTLSDSVNTGFPMIGDHVYIGAGAKIIGGVVIENNVRIDAGCLVTTDVPENSHVVNTGASTVICDHAFNNEHIKSQQFMERMFHKSALVYGVDVDDSCLTVRKAVPEDIDTIIALYKEKVLWLKLKKLSQWSRYLIHHPKQEFLSHIIGGEYYIVMKDGEIIAGFVLSEDSCEWNDPDANAYYIRRVVSRADYKGLGSYIAAQAKAITVADGKDALRLECVNSNQRLNELWESLGFAFVREDVGDYHYSLREWNQNME